MHTHAFSRAGGLSNDICLHPRSAGLGRIIEVGNARCQYHVVISHDRNAAALPIIVPPFLRPVFQLMMAGKRADDVSRHHKQDDPRDGSGDRPPARRHRLYTATIIYSAQNLMLQVFHASVASNRAEVAERLQVRHGKAAAARADIRLGLHAANPLTLALVPGPVVEVIRKVEAHGSRVANRGFMVNIEQRIEA